MTLKNTILNVIPQSLRVYLCHFRKQYCFIMRVQTAVLTVYEQARERAGILVRTFWLLCIPHLPRMQCTFQLTQSPSLFAGLSESQVSTVASCSRKHEQSDLQALDMDHADTAERTRPPPLSVRQLVLRRGLTVLVMVLILAAGILVYKLL